MVYSVYLLNAPNTEKLSCILMKSNISAVALRACPAPRCIGVFGVFIKIRFNRQKILSQGVKICERNIVR